MKSRRIAMKFRYRSRDRSGFWRRYGWVDPVKFNEAADRLRDLANTVASKDREMDRTAAALLAHVRRYPDMSKAWDEFMTERAEVLDDRPSAKEVVAWARATAARTGGAILRVGCLRLVVDNGRVDEMGEAGPQRPHSSHHVER